MSLEKIETVENPLLERTEISALFISKSGSLTRKQAIDLISKASWSLIFLLHDAFRIKSIATFSFTLEALKD